MGTPLQHPVRSRTQGGTCSSDLARMGHQVAPWVLPQHQNLGAVLPQEESTQLSWPNYGQNTLHRQLSST